MAGCNTGTGTMMVNAETGAAPHTRPGTGAATHLELDGISVSFPGVLAPDNVSFAVRGGEAPVDRPASDDRNRQGADARRSRDRVRRTDQLAVRARDRTSFHHH